MAFESDELLSQNALQYGHYFQRRNEKRWFSASEEARNASPDKPPTPNSLS
jgi:hypothetical protein